jgi:hypothetical protein
MRVTSPLSVHVWMMIALSSIPAISLGGPTTNKSNQFSGDWSWVLDFTPGLLVGVSANFVQDGKQLKGTVHIGERSRALKIANGKIEGDTISFEVEDIRNGMPLKCVFSGTLEGEKIKGKMHVLSADASGKPEKSDFDWSAERIQKDPEKRGSEKSTAAKRSGVDSPP